MLLYLFTFINQPHLLNIIHYVTFRSIFAALTSMLIMFIISPRIIKYLKSIQGEGQPIRLDGPASHLLTKKGTPTMGGIIMLTAIILTTLLWANLNNIYIWNCLFIIFSFGTLGGIDDYLKLTKKNTKGVSGKMKLVIQFIITIISYVWLNYDNHITPVLTFPFFKNIVIDLGWYYAIFMAIVVIGSSNAVNITDGLDGLATVPIIVSAGCFSIIAYLVGTNVAANHLLINYVQGVDELTVFCASIVGAGLGFLWYNAQPADIFMGDTGSLSLGGALGITGIITRHEILLSIIGGLFVIEAISVILQVYYFKLTSGKRIFLMAPLHHHFEKKNWPESKVVIRFWIISIIFALIGLASIKIR